MANEEQVRHLRRSIREWNKWREAEGKEGKGIKIDLTNAYLPNTDLSRANLRGANLRGATLTQANLTGAHLSRADLSYAKLSDADLSQANLSSVDLSQAELHNSDFTKAYLTNANLSRADLGGANLSRANLIDADLRGANLSRGNLVDADLRGGNLTGANLSDVSLSDSKFGGNSLGRIDLSGSLGLAEVSQRRPSDVSIRTLELTALGLANTPFERRGEVEAFLRGAGVPEMVMQAFQLMIESPIEFYSVFISYSHRDKPFARRLYEALQARGIRCWLDEHALLPGDDIADSIDHGIRIWDKVLLCCSEDSLRSYWVEAEVDKAVEKEQQLRKDRGKKVHAIIPLDLDGYLEKWQDGRASMIRKRLAADFTGWDTDHAKFEAQLERVCAALQTEREPGPTPKL